MPKFVNIFFKFQPALQIDAELRPVWAIVAEKTLLYVRSVMTKNPEYWPKMMMGENLQEGIENPYTKHLCKWMQVSNTTICTPSYIKRCIWKAAIKSILGQRMITSTTCFAMNPPQNSSRIQHWFKPKTWVSDSVPSKILAQFRTCNAGLGEQSSCLWW